MANTGICMSDLLTECIIRVIEDPDLPCVLCDAYAQCKSVSSAKPFVAMMVTT